MTDDAPTDDSAADAPTDDASTEDAAAEDRFDPDPERVRLLRDVADDVRGEDSESRQIAAILYRISDLYDEHEDTSPAEIYRNVKTILEVSERGTMER